MGVKNAYVFPLLLLLATAGSGRKWEMYLDLIIGFLALGYGLFQLAARIFGWVQFLEDIKPMKEKYGEVRGNLIHIAISAVIPILTGLVLLNHVYNFLW